MKSQILLSFLALISFSSCTETETITEYEYVDRIVKETVTETVTVIETNNIYVLPEEYSFTRNGISTVYYSGQTTRLKMATELKKDMKKDRI